MHRHRYTSRNRMGAIDNTSGSKIRVGTSKTRERHVAIHLRSRNIRRQGGSGSGTSGSGIGRKLWSCFMARIGHTRATRLQHSRQQEDDLVRCLFRDANGQTYDCLPFWLLQASRQVLPASRHLQLASR